MNIEKERELFEKTFKTLSHTFNESLCMIPNTDTYYSNIAQSSWEAWLASRNRDGYVLVPVDTLNRTVGHIAIALCHPNNSKNEEDVMHKDLEIIEKAMIGACDD